jgi:hypothetical protein
MATYVIDSKDSGTECKVIDPEGDAIDLTLMKNTQIVARVQTHGVLDLENLAENINAFTDFLMKRSKKADHDVREVTFKL